MLLTKQEIHKGLSSGVVYRIENSINLRRGTLIIPENCTLLFNNGDIHNGKIRFNNTSLLGKVVFKSVKPFGDIKNTTIFAPWFQEEEEAIHWMVSLSNKSIDFCHGQYLINRTLSISPGIRMKNASFIMCGKEAKSLLIISGKERKFGDKLDISGVCLEGISIDGNNKVANGIKISYCDGVELRDCRIQGIKANLSTNVVNGIYLYHSENIIVDSCHIQNVFSRIEAFYPRGITLVTCHNTKISNCIVCRIGDREEFHGDGIQIAVEDKYAMTDIGNNYIINCLLFDCRYRLLKLQQRGVTVSHSKFFTQDTMLSQLQSAISIYNSDVTISDNTITSKSAIPINLGVSNSAIKTVSNVLITNNLIENHSANYIGSIHTSNSDSSCFIRDINVTNNRFIDKSADNRNSGISIRNLAKGYHIKDNVFTGFSTVVEIRDKNFPNGSTLSDIVLQNNHFIHNRQTLNLLCSQENKQGVINSNNKYE